MSRNITVTETAKSDLSGREATEVRTLTFMGSTATLDLTAQEAHKFDEVIGKYMSKAHDLVTDPAVVREWAQANGFEVGVRGRLSAEVQAAYQAALTGASEAEVDAA